MLTKFLIYIESRFSDVATLKSDSGSFHDRIKSEINKTFIDDKDFIKYYTLKQRINNKKIRFNIDFHHNIKHNLKNRLRSRTTLKNIDEFNELIRNILDFLFPDKIDSLRRKGKYGIYFREYNFTVIFAFDIYEFVEDNYNLKIISIIPGYTEENLIKIFLFE
jgi:hypothetical protein